MRARERGGPATAVLLPGGRGCLVRSRGANIPLPAPSLQPSAASWEGSLSSKQTLYLRQVLSGQLPGTDVPLLPHPGRAAGEGRSERPTPSPEGTPTRAPAP